MNKKPKLGRPKLPKSEVKKVFPVRLTDAERLLFEKKAAQEKLTVSEWIRAALNQRASVA